jgi:hypothetical protein
MCVLYKISKNIKYKIKNFEIERERFSLKIILLILFFYILSKFLLSIDFGNLAVNIF